MVKSAKRIALFHFFVASKPESVLRPDVVRCIANANAIAFRPQQQYRYPLSFFRSFRFRSPTCAHSFRSRSLRAVRAVHMTLGNGSGGDGDGDAVSPSSFELSAPGAIDWLAEPVTVGGCVQRGFGRGSRDLGTPTANLPGSLLDGVKLTDRDGVYLGFGCVPKFGRTPLKMVANLGRNITYDDVPERVLEAYLMSDTLPLEFYGEEMRLCIVGFMRPEYKFSSLDELILHINNDVKVAKQALDLPQAQKFIDHLPLK